jgi:hypothetical protein
MLRFLTGVLLLLVIFMAGCKKEEVPPSKRVQVLYLIPADKNVNPDYVKGIQQAAPILQQWYKEQMQGKTFRFTNPLIITLHSDKPASWFITDHDNSGADWLTYSFYNILGEAQRLLGSKWNTDQYTYTIYFHGEGPGAGIPGVAIMPENDLRGLAGQMEEPVSRWIGGWGHELGHAFGLPHPPDGDPSWDHAIMGFGYLTFPNAFLLPSDKETLIQSGFFY